MAADEAVASLSEMVRGLDEGSVDAAELSLDGFLAGLGLDPAVADLEQLTLALVHAARCAELKARSLLPASSPPPAEVSPEEAALPVDTPDELAARLAGYTAFRAAADVLRAYESEAAARFASRPERGAGSRGGVGGAAAAAAAGPRGGQEPGAAEAGDGAGDGGEDPGADGGDGEGRATGLDDLIAALRDVWERAAPSRRTVFREPLRVEDRVAFLRSRLRASGEAEFAALFAGQASRLEVVVTFLAVLELIRLGEVRAYQAGPFQPIRLRWSAPPGASGGQPGGPAATGR